jgi:signal transduction histidine kinase
MSTYDLDDGEPASDSIMDLRTLSIRILDHANRGVSWDPFLRGVLNTLLDFTRCDVVGLRVSGEQLNFRCEITRRPKRSFVFRSTGTRAETIEENLLPNHVEDPTEQIYRQVMTGKTNQLARYLTPNGTFWLSDTSIPLSHGRDDGNASPFPFEHLRDFCRSIALIPLVLPQKHVGLLNLLSAERFFFTNKDIETYEGVAQMIGLAMVGRSARSDSNERVKELTCLYGIARAAGEPEIPLDDMLFRIAELLPPAWQYPEVTTGRIIVDGKSYETGNFKEGAQKQSADIVVNGESRGSVEVFYTEEEPHYYEGPFLKEERSLIDTVAREVALIIDRREAEQYRSILQEQLRHADRLATLGQLAAGIAHELNEPIGAALGFAQLAQKCPGVPEPCLGDLEKIVKAALHAREVVRKVLLFARQMPAHKTQVNLNQLVQEGLYFLESRCAKQQVELVRKLDPDLPEVLADAPQIHQVLVNLVVNALQAMPNGGKLSISTKTEDEKAVLIVEDSGTGMTQEVLRQVFVPFFTTKDIGQGTGLGLSVAHGIVTSHGGTMDVSTQIGKGSIFKVLLPIQGQPKPKEDV